MASVGTSLIIARRNMLANDVETPLRVNFATLSSSRENAISITLSFLSGRLCCGCCRAAPV